MGRCPRTEAEFHREGHSNGYLDRSPFAPSLDRIDPEGGYTKDNVQVVVWFYNCAKQRFTDDEVIDLCTRIAETAAR